jgi:peptidoglycan/xylan/chitin deacetylase (PgdA/CDA1 family)
VAVTFDDGYADNLLAAVPVLERHEIPATVFVATGAIGRDREFWWDELARLLLHPGTCDDATWRQAVSWNASDPPPTGRHALYLTLWRRLRALPEAEQERVLDDLAASAGIGRAARPSHRPLATAEAEALARAPLVEIGAHTVTHPFLSGLPPASQASEIRTSKALCEALAGRPVESFAYPFGGYTAETVAAVREAGFARACSTEADPVRSNADLFGLPRLQVQDWDGDELERRLSGGLGA